MFNTVSLRLLGLTALLSAVFWSTPALAAVAETAAAAPDTHPWWFWPSILLVF